MTRAPSRGPRKPRTKPGPSTSKPTPKSTQKPTPKSRSKAKAPARPYVSKRSDPRQHPKWPSLDPAQRDACLYVYEHEGSVLLSGAAGSGKSTTISVIADTTDAATTATTACAASLVHGVTLHSLLHWIPNQNFVDWCKRIHIVRRKLANIRVLIVDEISMLSCHDFATLDRMLRKVAAGLESRKATCTKPFGGFCLVLVGDMLQLPPVSGPAFYTGDLFAQLAPRVIVLSRIFRQTAPLFLHLLASLRYGYSTPLAALTVLALEARARDLVAESNALHLYAVNSLCDAHNLSQLRLFGTRVCFERSWELGITAPGTYDIHGKRVKVVAEVPDEGRPPPAAQILLATGCPVRIVANIDQRAGLVNGAVAVVESIDADARAVTVRLPGGMRHVIEERAVYSRVWKLGNGRKLTDWCRCLPLVLAFAQTVHSAQGLTSGGPTVVDTTHRFVFAALLYVAMSRATRLDHVLPRGVSVAMTRVAPQKHALEFLKTHGLDLAAEHAALDADSAAMLPRFVPLFAAEARLDPGDVRRLLRGVFGASITRTLWARFAPAWEELKSTL